MSYGYMKKGGERLREGIEALVNQAYQQSAGEDGGWEYGGNAPASVDGACQILVACDVTDASHDNQQATPIAQATLANLAQAGMERPKDEGGIIQAIPATLDNGYDREAAVEALE